MWLAFAKHSFSAGENATSVITGACCDPYRIVRASSPEIRFHYVNNVPIIFSLCLVVGLTSCGTSAGTGAAAGAATGAVVGGPIGAAAGGGRGGTFPGLVRQKESRHNSAPPRCVPHSP